MLRTSVSVRSSFAALYVLGQGFALSVLVALLIRPSFLRPYSSGWASFGGCSPHSIAASLAFGSLRCSYFAVYTAICCAYCSICCANAAFALQMQVHCCAMQLIAKHCFAMRWPSATPLQATGAKQSFARLRRTGDYWPTFGGRPFGAVLKKDKIRAKSQN